VAAPAEGVSVAGNSQQSGQPRLLILSAETPSALDEALSCLREQLTRIDDADFDDLTRSLQLKDAAHKYRRTVVCASRGDALAVLSDGATKRVLSGELDAVQRTRVFMLPGVGDQYVGMGYGLYAECDAFRNEVDRCAEMLAPHLGVDIRSILYPPGQSWKQAAQSKGIDLKRMLGQAADDPPDPDTIRLNTTIFSQPALFTIEYATARLWLSLGVAPGAIVGHSMGEYVAACLAGVLSLEDAVRLVAVRARLVNELPQAIMLAVMVPEDQLAPLLPADLCISLINGPNHCVIAGPPESVTAFEAKLAEREIISRRVQNGHAFHTPMMDPVARAFEAELRTVRLSPPAIPYVSNVTGTWITAPDATDPLYWLRHLTRAARFSEALHELWKLPEPMMIECGPGRTLSVLAIQHPDRRGPLRGGICSIRQRYEHDTDMQVFLGATGRIWLAGTPIRWDGLQRVNTHSAENIRAAPTSVPQDPGPTVAAVAASTPASDDAPANDRERQLVAIWRTALGRDDVGVNDSFGALGGDSLSSVGALLELRRIGLPDEIARGLYRGLTIREMVREEAASGGGAQRSTAINGIPLAAVETSVFLRAVGIYLVMASHFGLTALVGNPVLMIVSGLSFAKFQLQAIAKQQSISPIFRFMSKIAIPALVDTMARQIWHHSFYPRSFLLMDNLMEPYPFGPHQSPYYIDLLLQNLLIAAVPLSVPAIRKFAIQNPFVYGMAGLLICWMLSVIVPLIVDPNHIWVFVPHVYMWLLALGWCAAYSANRRQKVLATVTFLCLNVISHVVGRGLDWYVAAAALALIWLDEVPAQIPAVLVRAINSIAAASLFIYLTHYAFSFIIQAVWARLPIEHSSEAPVWLVIPLAMVGGYVVYRIWNFGSRVLLTLLGRSGRLSPAPATGSW